MMSIPIFKRLPSSAGWIVFYLGSFMVIIIIVQLSIAYHLFHQANLAASSRSSDSIEEDPQFALARWSDNYKRLQEIKRETPELLFARTKEKAKELSNEEIAAIAKSLESYLEAVTQALRERQPDLNTVESLAGMGENAGYDADDALKLNFRSEPVSEPTVDERERAAKNIQDAVRRQQELLRKTAQAQLKEMQAYLTSLRYRDSAIAEERVALLYCRVRYVRSLLRIYRFDSAEQSHADILQRLEEIGL